MLPQIWTSVKAGWMKFAEAVGWVNTRILLTIAYLLIAPAALVLAILRKDLLRERLSNGRSYWIAKERTEHSLENAKHQF